MKTLKKINYNALAKSEMKMVTGGNNTPTNGTVVSSITSTVSCGDERHRFRNDQGLCYKVLFHNFCTNVVIREVC